MSGTFWVRLRVLNTRSPKPRLEPDGPLTPSVVLCVPEASKLVMSYVAAVCGKGQEVNKVKEQLLQSNPVLEGEYLTLFMVSRQPCTELEHQVVRQEKRRLAVLARRYFSS